MSTFQHKYIDKLGNEIALDSGKYYVLYANGSRSAFDTIEEAIGAATVDDIVIAGEKGDVRSEDARARNISVIEANKVDADQTLTVDQQYTKREIHRRMIDYGLIEGYNIAGLQFRLDADTAGVYDQANNLWLDSSGNGWHGEIKSGVQYVDTGFKFFGGTDSYIRMPFQILEGDITLSMTYKLSTLSAIQCLFNSFPHNVLSVATVDGRGDLRVYIGDGSNWLDIIYSNKNVSVDTEVHIAVTISATNGTKLYVNGILAGSSTFTPTGWDNFFNIGNNVMVSESFTGAIRNCILYDSELTAAQVATLADLAVPKPTLPYYHRVGMDLTGMYPFYGDASSSGSARATFNFGQDAWLGDPMGFSPFDSTYDPSYWKGSALIDGSGRIYTGNLGTAYYDHVSYVSGKYYFEVTIEGTPHADATGMITPYSAQFTGASRHAGVHLGSYSANNPAYVKCKGMSRIPIFDTPLPYQITGGSGYTLQFYLNYDAGAFLVKRVGSTIAEHDGLYVAPSAFGTLP